MRLGGSATLANEESVNVPERVVESPSTPGIPRRRGTPGRVIGVFSGKGGVGKSALVANLAAAVARDFDLGVAVADLSLQFGDQALMFDKPQYPSIADVLANADALTDEFLLDCMHEAANGLRILGAPPAPELADLVQSAHVRDVIDRLRDLFDLVVLDTSSYLSDATLEALEASDTRIVLTTPHLSALKDTKLLLRSLAELKIPAQDISLVLNRVESGIKMNLDVFETNLRFALDAELPHVGTALAESAVDGVPLVLSHGSTDWSKRVAEIAARVGADEGGGDSRKRKKGFLGLRRP